jgi:hypothetical protein
MTALLPNASFILKPYLDRLAGQNTASQKGVLHQAGEDGVDGPQRHQPCHSTGRNNLS